MISGFRLSRNMNIFLLHNSTTVSLEIFCILLLTLFTGHALGFLFEICGLLSFFFPPSFMQSSVLLLGINFLENYFLQISICSLLAFQSPIPSPCPKGEKHSASGAAFALISSIVFYRLVENHKVFNFVLESINCTGNSKKCTLK